MQLNVVPAWVGAAPVGASFAIGGKMAVYYKKWDDSTQSWTYNVELKKVDNSSVKNVVEEDFLSH